MSPWLVRPQTTRAILPRPCGAAGGFARGRASTPIQTWSARARAPPTGAPRATTDADQPHRERVRQTSLPRHSRGRSTERPFRFVVVDHTGRPSLAVPSREGTPTRHDQHRRFARNPPSVDTRSLRLALLLLQNRPEPTRVHFHGTGGRSDSGSKHAACCRRAPIQGQPPGSRSPVVPPPRHAFRTAGTIILRMAGNILK